MVEEDEEEEMEEHCGLKFSGGKPKAMASTSYGLVLLYWLILLTVFLTFAVITNTMKVFF